MKELTNEELLMLYQKLEELIHFLENERKHLGENDETNGNG